MQPLAPLNLPNTPPPPLRRLLEEILILLKRPPSTFGTVHPTPPARECVRDAEDEEEPVGEVVEHDGREECDGEVGEAPDDNRDGGALAAAGGGVYLGGHKPGRDEPADAEDGGGEVEDDDAGEAGGEEGNVEGGFVHGEAAEDGQDAKADCHAVSSAMVIQYSWPRAIVPASQTRLSPSASVGRSDQ